MIMLFLYLVFGMTIATAYLTYFRVGLEIEDDRQYYKRVWTVFVVVAALWWLIAAAFLLAWVIDREPPARDVMTKDPYVPRHAHRPQVASA